MYPPREEERDSKMDGFKLDIFYREAGINRSTGELLLHDWSSTKSCLEPDSWRRSAKRAWREGFVLQANAVQVVLLGGKPGPMEAPALDCRTTWRLLAIDFLLELGLKMY